MNTKGVEDGMSDEQAVRQIHPKAHENFWGPIYSDPYEGGIKIGESWSDARAKLRSETPEELTAQPAVPVEERTRVLMEALKAVENERLEMHEERLREAENLNLYRKETGEDAAYSLAIHHVESAIKKLITAPIPEERTAEMGQWVAVPNEQGWWWHWDGDKEHVAFMYCVLASMTGKQRQFIGYPDSRWCDEVGGLWLKAKVPKPPADHIEGKAKAQSQHGMSTDLERFRVCDGCGHEVGMCGDCTKKPISPAKAEEVQE